MPEKKSRRSSPQGPLQILRKNSLDGSYHVKSSDNSGYMGLHPTKPRPASRISIRTDSDSYGVSYSYSYSYSSRNATPISTQSSFQSQVPASPDQDPKYAAPSSRTCLLPSQTRFSSCSSVSSSANPAQTSMLSLHQRWSRLPTPAYQPDDRYSREMYQSERRRSVFSSLGKKCTSLRRSFDRAVIPQGTGKRITSDSGLKITSVQSPVTKSRTGSTARILSNNSGKSSTSRKCTMIPLPKSSSMLSLLSSHASKGAVETTTELEEGPSSDEDAAWPLPPRLRNGRKRPSLRKVRVKLHSLPLKQRHRDEERAYYPSRHLSQTIARAKDEMASKKIWAQGRPGFKASEKISPGTVACGLENHSNGSPSWKSGVQAGVSQIPIPLSPGKQTGGGRGRSRDQTERMVSCLYTTLPSAFPKPARLMGRQVSDAKSKHYWLGRFVTLTNAFHYEDSFNEPDAATGFGMLSIYSHRLADCVDGPSYRAKRAFRVLDNVCMTEEASVSLRRFREEYVRRFGGRWLGY